MSDSLADTLMEFLGSLLYEPEKAKLNIKELPTEFRELGEGLTFFAQMLKELRAFSDALGKGNLSVPIPSNQNELAAPLKSLHASLRHLTWQSQQVAKGDYKQKVDFMGEFAEAFNTMTQQLEERRNNLLAEIESSRQKTRALEQNIVLFEALTEKAPQWIIVLEHETNKHLMINQTAKEILALKTELPSKLLAWMEKQISAAPNEEVNRHHDIAITAGKVWYLDITCYPLIWLKQRATAFVVIDMSKERKYMQELESVAFRDALTQVNSRHYGMKTLYDWVNSKRDFCLCFIDMDGLKYVNDTFGHQAGDDYIVSVAKILTSFSPDAMVNRLGGDEFMLLQLEWPKDKVEERLAELRQELALQDTGPGHPYTRSISYGVSHVTPENTTDASEILQRTDELMYNFKRTNKKQRLN
ncbi:MAG: diguanylate cyclase [Planctomycetota bacterium]|jgi:diguanylate cyclase (GGDEF)-like protein|nr:diguanylate cyclase [Planctomycetota bacterium]